MTQVVLPENPSDPVIGVFAFHMVPQGDENIQDLARFVSSKYEWRDEVHSREDVGCEVHRGVYWAVVVQEVDEEGHFHGGYVLALARNPSRDDYIWMSNHRAPGTVYNVSDAYQDGHKLAMGHNGPLHPPTA